MSIRINLAPPETRRRRAFTLTPRLPEFNIGLGVAIASAIVVVGLGSYYYSLSRQESTLQSAVQRANSELQTIKITLGQGSKVRAQLDDLKARLEAIETLSKTQARPIALFDALADTLPKDLWLTGLEDKASDVKVTGTAFSATAVADFLSNLRTSGRFMEVDLVSSKQDLAKSPRLVTFEAACRFGG
jgi:type IV pilus assembly protein PilN